MIVDKFNRVMQPKTFAYFEKFKGDIHLIYITEIDEKKVTYIDLTGKSDLRNRRNNPLLSPDYLDCDLGTCMVSRSNDMITTTDFEFQNAYDVVNGTFAFIRDKITDQMHLCHHIAKQGHYKSERLERYLSKKFVEIFGK